MYIIISSESQGVTIRFSSYTLDGRLSINQLNMSNTKMFLGIVYDTDLPSTRKKVQIAQAGFSYFPGPMDFMLRRQLSRQTDMYLSHS